MYQTSVYGCAYVDCVCPSIICFLNIISGSLCIQAYIYSENDINKMAFLYMGHCPSLLDSTKTGAPYETKTFLFPNINFLWILFYKMYNLVTSW